MSRDLDARVAEAMGLVPCDNWQHFHAGTMIKIDDACGHEACYPRGRPAHYSTDIAAAWQVVAWAISREWSFDITWEPFDCDPPAWWATFTKGTTYQGASTSAPEAICLAFLKAIEAQLSATPYTADGSQDSTRHRDG